MAASWTAPTRRTTTKTATTPTLTGVKTVTDGNVAGYDVDAVGDLLSDVTDDGDNRRRVREVDGIKPVHHGIAVTLTVEIPTRTKGMTAGGDALDQ